MGGAIMKNVQRVGKPTAHFLGWDDSDENLTRIDALYGAPMVSWPTTDYLPDAYKPLIFSKIGRSKLREYFGYPDDVQVYLAAAADPSLFNVGARGRIWALAFLIATYAKHNFTEPGALAGYIIKSTASDWNEIIASKTAPFADAKDCRRLRTARDTGEFLTNELRDIISEHQKSSCPPIELAAHFVRLTALYCRATVFGRDPNWVKDPQALQRFETVLAAPYSRPSTLYRELRSLLPPSIKPPSRRLKLAPPSLDTATTGEQHILASISRIDPVLNRGVYRDIDRNAPAQFIAPSEAEFDDPIVTKIWSWLNSHDEQAKRILILTGPLSSGKKTVLNRLLRVIANGERLLFTRSSSYSRRNIHLPVCALSAKGRNYQRLIRDIVVFLRRYHSALKQGRHQASYAPDSSVDRSTLEDLLTELQDLHRSAPAIFIIADVDAFHVDPDRNIVRDIGIIRLLTTLQMSNSQSATIITTTAELADHSTSLRPLPMPQYEKISIAEPKISDVISLVPASKMRLLDELRLCDAAIFSDDMHAVSALVRITDDVPSIVRALRDYDTHASRREQIRHEIYERLLLEIDRRGLLAPISLIAASDDGLRLNSLVRLLDTWRSTRPDIVASRDAEALHTTLSEFAADCGGKFILLSPMARYDPDEYELNESHNDKDGLWEMDALIAETLLDALHRSHETIAHEVNRLIAWLARTRAQMKRIMNRSPVGSRVTEDASRDIQCFVSLLASINPKDLVKPDTNLNPLRLDEAGVLSIDQDRFNGRRALRFAVTCLLREDIDHNHRLTMVYDEDVLRLDLYLRLFNELGQRCHTLFKPLSPRRTLPQHFLIDVFAEDDILELMNTVALTAYHAQRFDVVTDMVRLAEEFCEQRNISQMASKLVRIWCSQIDAWILMGGVSDNPHRNHAQTLTYVRNKQAEHFGFVDDLLRSLDPSTPPTDPAALKAAMRLLAREAELTGLIYADRAEAASLYAKLLKLERYWASHFVDHDPVVLNGRVARRYLKFLLKDRCFDSDHAFDVDTRNHIEAEVREIIGANVSRLKRFSGADRVGVMLDIARLYSATGNYPLASEWAREASVRAFSGNVSHAGKLDVLEVSAEIHIRLAELGQIDGDPARTARIEVQQLMAIADRLKAEPHLACGHIFTSRLLTLQASRSGDGSNQRRRTLDTAEKTLQKASEALALLQDHSFIRMIAHGVKAIDAARERLMISIPN